MNVNGHNFLGHDTIYFDFSLFGTSEAWEIHKYLSQIGAKFFATIAILAHREKWTAVCIFCTVCASLDDHLWVCIFCKWRSLPVSKLLTFLHTGQKST